MTQYGRKYECGCKMVWDEQTGEIITRIVCKDCSSGKNNTTGRKYWQDALKI